MLVRWRGHGFRVTSHVCTLAPPLESRTTWQRIFWPQSLFPLLQNWSNNSKLTESWAFRSRIRKTCSLTPGPQQVPRASEFPSSRLQSVSYAAPLRRLAWGWGGAMACWYFTGTQAGTKQCKQTFYYIPKILLSSPSSNGETQIRKVYRLVQSHTASGV